MLKLILSLTLRDTPSTRTRAISMIIIYGVKRYLFEQKKRRKTTKRRLKK